MVLGSLGLKVRERRGVVGALQSRALGSLQAHSSHAARNDVADLRMGLFHTASELFDRGGENRQARDNDTEQRFQDCRNAEPCDAVGVIVESYLGRQDETDDSDNAYAVHIEIS